MIKNFLYLDKYTKSFKSYIYGSAAEYHDNYKVNHSIKCIKCI